ncbi:MAG: insulinase family protein [Lachnospiraceae bacterium]|nr:insulinase family protein [Lachnospiraceae bacterium]
MKKFQAYEVIEEREIGELRSKAFLCRHKKTGARVILMENEDDNKVFYIGFRTTPEESTGVSHILEHSVLCGSKHFPVKDPFIELAKGSLNTFLNAMTYPDKTVYPVASCNDKDFKNLMHVYLDAVFYPNIYDHDLTFKQEGWHYEMEDENSPLTINGVVYNEMKGAFSSPDDVLEREILNSLFPDNAYREESGGDPEDIPKLTYEHYIKVHQTYYHPSNSYIYLYGNMDMGERLEFLDREYLSRFEALEVDSEVALQKPFAAPVFLEKQFSVTEEEELKENTYLSYNTAMETNLNPMHYLAFKILDYAICSSPAAPLKKALLDAGIGKDVYSFYDSGVKQPYFSIISKNTEKERREEFVRLIEATLEKLSKEGINKDSLKAALNYYEFKYREGDFGSYPPGLMYGLQILDSWLYDDDKPFIHVAANETFKELRSRLETGYFEGLLEEYLLKNTHKTILMVEPVVNLAEKKEEALKKELEVYRASLNPEEIQKIVEETKALREYQEQENTPEELACIPLLHREDIKKKTEPLCYEVRKVGENISLYHNIYTNGIGYFRLLFKAGNVPADMLTWLGVLKQILGLVDTTAHSYGDLYNQIHMETGGISPAVNIYVNSQNLEDIQLTFEWKVKALETNLEKAFGLMKEILLDSLFTDGKRLYEILAEAKSRMQADMIGAGHRVAAGRATSYFSSSAALQEEISGLPLYRLVADLEKNFEEKKEELQEKLKALCNILFTGENLMYDYTGSEEGYEVFSRVVADFSAQLPKKDRQQSGLSLKKEKKQEGLVTAGQVQYVAKAGNFISKGLPYTGALRVLKVIMGYDYLWNQVRVKGGAYGCMAGFGKNGDSYFVSYRDPNLEKTLQVYQKAAAYLKAFTGEERTMTQYIIGAVSDLDVPLTPQAKGLRSLSAYMTGQSEEDFQRERDQLLSVTGEEIRRMAAYVEAILEDDCLCVVGTRSKIEENEKLFGRVENLL